MNLFICDQQPLPRVLACAFLLAGAGLYAAPPDDHPLDSHILVEDHPVLDKHVLANMEMGDCVANCGKVVTLGGRPVFVLRDGSGVFSFHLATAEKPDSGLEAFWPMALEVAKRQDGLQHIPTLDEAILQELDTRECVSDCGKTYFVGGHYTLVWRDADGQPSLHVRGDGNNLAWGPIYARYDSVRPQIADISAIETGGCVADCRMLVRVGVRLGLAIRNANGRLLLHFAGEPPMMGAHLGIPSRVAGGVRLSYHPVIPPGCEAGPTDSSRISVELVENLCVCTPADVQYEVVRGGKKVTVTIRRTRWSWAETLVFRDCFGQVLDRRVRSGNMILPAGSSCPC